MITIKHTSTNPYYNLALEEYLLKEHNIHDDIFYVWRNEPSIIIGRNQNPLHEVNIKYAALNQIPIIRRISGGGTVVHDLGNINFTYITTKKQYTNDYEYFINPIILILQKFGINARFEPNSHIYIKDKKVSGNAQSVHKDKLIHHGTILYDIDIDFVKNCLREKSPLQGTFVKSTKASIINLKQLIPIDTTIESLMNYLHDELLLHAVDTVELSLNDFDQQKINSLITEKYSTYNWNFGHQMDFALVLDDFSIEIKKGIIINCSEKQLIHLPLQYKRIEKELKSHPNKDDILKKIF